MNSSRYLYFKLCLFNYFIGFPSLITSEFIPDADFNRHRLFHPKVYHAREHRLISNSKINQDDLKHIEEIVIYLDINERQYTLDLRLNRGLISKTYFEKHQADEGHIVNRPKMTDVELCYYNGNIRGISNSWAAISTCDGVSGVVYDGETTHYIHPVPGSNINGSVNGVHVMYSHDDLNSNYTCGFSDSINYHEEDSHHVLHRNKRSVRSQSTIHGPYNANKNSRYVELVLVIDRTLYKNLNEDLDRVKHRCKEIANIINSLFMPLNIYVALVGVVIWTNFDEIAIETDGDTTLTNFLRYRREHLVEKYSNDNAQLLTRIQFRGGVVGKALKGPICTYQFSGGVNMYHSSTVGLVATTVAHEMGHNLGMEHDTEDCNCPSDRCIMSPSASSSSPTDWSSCSQEFLTFSFAHGMDYCLRNKPKNLFDGPVCGNAFVEPGEQCDCGLPERCNNSCCNASTCMLHPNATCAIGECCDLNTCKLRSIGTECRSAYHECDLPEYCSGYSEYCPDNVYKINGETCNSGEAYCYEGNCRTHSDQCQLLWGSSGENSDARCYELNSNGNRHGNCGYNRLNQTYKKCDTGNIKCGMLQCKHLNEKLEFGMESLSILSQSFITVNSSIIVCRTAVVDLGVNDVDPGLVPDGSKCGDNMMCLDQQCLSIDDMRAMVFPGACPNDCNKNGICNSKGRCHCKVGFGPPFCEFSGPGGSEDSGPASHPDQRSATWRYVYLILLLLFTFMAIIVVYSYYRRRSPTHFWKSSCHPVHCEKTKSFHTNDRCKDVDHRSKNAGMLAGRGGTSIFSNSTIQSLLSADDLKSPTRKTAPSIPITIAPVKVANDNDSDNGNDASRKSVSSEITNQLIGNFKGFVLTPLSSGVSTTTTAHRNRTTTITSVSSVAPKTSNSFDNYNNNDNNNKDDVIKPIRPAPKTPFSPATITFPSYPAPPIPSQRPCISAPILDNTTSSTVKEMIKNINSENSTAPSRPAPPIPDIENNSLTTSSSSSNNNNDNIHHQTSGRPTSTPISLISHNLKSNLTEKHAMTSKDFNYSTLGRITSFVSKSPLQQQQSKVVNADDKKIIGDTPSKANKIDKDILRSLKISEPILLNDLNIPPSNPLPLGKEQERAVIMRTRSLRQPSSSNNANNKRPNIPSFGSARYPDSKRPTSIPASSSCSRPTSPPPQPPALTIAGRTATNIAPDDIYEDCLNIKLPPERRATISEETDDDNIYSTIEENPITPPRRRNYTFKNDDSINNSNNNHRNRIINDDDNSERKQINTLPSDSLLSGSNSVDLLNEIVSEIHARKFTNRTLVEDDNLSAITDISSISTSTPNPLYENSSSIKQTDDNDVDNYDRLSFPVKSGPSSTTSSGYLRPISSTVSSSSSNSIISNDSKTVNENQPITDLSAPKSKNRWQTTKNNVGGKNETNNNNSTFATDKKISSFVPKNNARDHQNIISHNSNKNNNYSLSSQSNAISPSSNKSIAKTANFNNGGNARNSFNNKFAGFNKSSVNNNINSIIKNHAVNSTSSVIKTIPTNSASLRTSNSNNVTLKKYPLPVPKPNIHTAKNSIDTSAVQKPKSISVSENLKIATGNTGKAESEKSNPRPKSTHVASLQQKFEITKDSAGSDVAGNKSLKNNLRTSVKY